MKTTVLDEESAAGTPRLEVCDLAQGVPAITWISSTPFRLGRCESCELPIRSSHVSRIHAVILKEGQAYRICDQKSTNGTFVNGDRIEEQWLADGDVIAIGQIEFRYIAGQPKRESNSTLILDQPTAPGGSPRHLITAIRRYQEAISHRCVVNRFEPVMDLNTGHTCGFEWLGVNSSLAKHLIASDFKIQNFAEHLTMRFQRAARRVAIEEVMRHSFENFVVLPFSESDLTSRQTVDDVANLCDLVPSPEQIVVQVALSVQRGLARFPAIRDELRKWNARISLSGVDLEFAETLESVAVLPDFARLAPLVLRRIAEDAASRTCLSRAIRSCRDRGCEIVAMGLVSDEDRRLWLDLGGRYGQGTQPPADSDAGSLTSSDGWRAIPMASGAV